MPSSPTIWFLWFFRPSTLIPLKSPVYQRLYQVPRVIPCLGFFLNQRFVKLHQIGFQSHQIESDTDNLCFFRPRRNYTLKLQQQYSRSSSISHPCTDSLPTSSDFSVPLQSPNPFPTNFKFLTHCFRHFF